MKSRRILLMTILKGKNLIQGTLLWQSREIKEEDMAIGIQSILLIYLMKVRLWDKFLFKFYVRASSNLRKYWNRSKKNNVSILFKTFSLKKIILRKQ